MRLFTGRCVASRQKANKEPAVAAGSETSSIQLSAWAAQRLYASGVDIGRTEN
jgi:hypothetical protein